MGITRVRNRPHKREWSWVPVSTFNRVIGFGLLGVVFAGCDTDRSESCVNLDEEKYALGLIRDKYSDIEPKEVYELNSVLCRDIVWANDNIFSAKTNTRSCIAFNRDAVGDTLVYEVMYDKNTCLKSYEEYIVYKDSPTSIEKTDLREGIGRWRATQLNPLPPPMPLKRGYRQCPAHAEPRLSCDCAAQPHDDHGQWSGHASETRHGRHRGDQDRKATNYGIPVLANSEGNVGGHGGALTFQSSSTRHSFPVTEDEDAGGKRSRRMGQLRLR